MLSPGILLCTIFDKKSNQEILGRHLDAGIKATKNSPNKVVIASLLVSTHGSHDRHLDAIPQYLNFFNNLESLANLVGKFQYETSSQTCKLQILLLLMQPSQAGCL